MIMLRILLICFLCFSIAAPASAQTLKKDDWRDSIDFLMDDGEMTPDEMEEEALGVYSRCVNNPIKTAHYDCECIGAKFLVEREKAGPYELQYNLLQIVYTQTPKCVNDVAIAGKNYQDCKVNVEIMRRGESNNEEYCECVGRRSVTEFKLLPGLRNRTIQYTRANAMSYCMQQHPAVNLIGNFSVPN